MYKPQYAEHADALNHSPKDALYSQVVHAYPNLNIQTLLHVLTSSDWYALVPLVSVNSSGMTYFGDAAYRVDGPTFALEPANHI